MQKALKKRLFSTEKIKQSRKRLADAGKKTVKQLLAAKRDDLNMTPISIDTSIVETDTEMGMNYLPSFLIFVYFNCRLYFQLTELRQKINCQNLNRAM